MHKSDIERLLDLEIEKYKRVFQQKVENDDLYITALDYNDEVIILRCKIQNLSDTGIIVIANPDRADKDGELYQLHDLLSLKMVIFTLDLTEEEILELIEIEEEESEDNIYLEDDGVI